MNRKVLGFLLLGLCVLSSPALAMTAAEEEEAWKKEPAYGKTIRIGYNGGLCLGTFGIAQEMGYYAEEGLKTEIVNMTAVVDAIGTGKVDLLGNHIAAMMVPAANGVKMRFTTGIHTGCKSLYALTDGPINSTSDLDGQTVGISTGIGGSDHNITLRFFSHDGMDPKGVKFKNIDASVIVMAMQNGEIQAATMSDQYAQQFVDDGTLKIIRSLTFDEDFKLEPCCIHAVNSDFMDQNPIAVKKLTRAHEKASQYIMDHPEEALDILYEHQWASGDRDLALYILKTYDFSISDELTEVTLRNIIDDYKDFGLINASQDTEELLGRIWFPVLMKK